MGCVCCSLSSFISILLDALERYGVCVKSEAAQASQYKRKLRRTIRQHSIRATLCTVCALLTCCLLITLILMLVLGIGVGFHYCFVQSSVEAMGRAAKAAGALRSGTAQSGPVMRSLDRANRRGNFPGFSNDNRNRRAIDKVPPLSNNNTLIVYNITEEFRNDDYNTSDVSSLNRNVTKLSRLLA